MVRVSFHTLKFSNDAKQVWVDTLLQDYQIALEFIIPLPKRAYLSKQVIIRTRFNISDGN